MAWEVVMFTFIKIGYFKIVRNLNLNCSDHTIRSIIIETIQQSLHYEKHTMISTCVSVFTAVTLAITSFTVGRI